MIKITLFFICTQHCSQLLYISQNKSYQKKFIYDIYIYAETKSIWFWQVITYIKLYVGVFHEAAWTTWLHLSRPQNEVIAQCGAICSSELKKLHKIAPHHTHSIYIWTLCFKLIKYIHTYILWEEVTQKQKDIMDGPPEKSNGPYYSSVWA